MSMRLARGIAILVLTLLPTAIAAETKQPTGYGKLKFGASVEEAQKAFPDLEKLPAEKSLGAAVVGGPHITRYALKTQTLDWTDKPATVELRFWKGKFWLYIVYFGRQQVDATLAHLKKEYGEPKSPDAQFPVWDLEKTTILVEPKSGRYTVNDQELSKEAQAWFVEAFQKARAGKGEKIEIITSQETPAPAAAQSPSPAAEKP